ncbi:DNA translocase FtsK [Pararhizobium sp.]|uniref:DNA translocase FtsK n=1 Tax=Pararhizobium sp. TaxID=1977563 RepID=UPI002726B053|nr:DNA translocase FtsK [Pararhizobium sp.]MDO9418805.1 DNA translocase FtsK [Pararhizobium sp.]
MRISRTNISNSVDGGGGAPADGPERSAAEIKKHEYLLSKAEKYRQNHETRKDAAEVPVAQRASADVAAADQIEGRADKPVWQTAFALRPNVRFTRTPESAKKGPGGRDEMMAPVPVAALQEQIEEALAKAEPVRVAAAPATVALRSVAEPVPPPVHGIRALSLRLEQEMAARTASADISAHDLDLDLVCYPLEPAKALPAAQKAAHKLPIYVSDAVFWESMDLEAKLETLAPVVHVPLPEFHAPLNSVTALYREVSTRNAASRAAVPVSAPVVAVPERPVAPRIRAVRAVAATQPVAAVHVATPAPVAAVAPVAVIPVVEQRAVDITPRAIVKRAEPAAVAPVPGDYEFPSIDLLQEPTVQETAQITQEALEQSAGLLESVLEDFGVRGEIIDVRPGPVVTLYEFEPAPGVKSSRVIGLADDIARSMSALSARVAVVPGRNVIGIELPNPIRETVYFRELIESEQYDETRFKLALCLGKTIGGEPVIAELAKMPHLLVAGTTGSGKSVAINTMILSLLYRLKPEECRLIMVDPKMLELSVYDGIPHLLTPVVTDPKKAVMALKWAVREMEERYKKMSRLGVRNIDGYNARAASARAKGETVLCTVQTGFDRSTGEAIYEQEEMDLAQMPYIVVIVDEMADLMMVAGKEIEGAIQRLAQMARAAGIHLIMATQRPSVDVITGTIKANFPTRISFQVTSKIDSRTILGEQGAEHLLGQGDMLHMVGGGRIARVHGPFVSDEEVEKVVAHLKTQGRPEYLGTVTEDAEEMDEAGDEDSAVFDKGNMAEEDGNDLYDKAVKVVLRDKKCSTSYIQRRLSIGYNRAASLVERMEKEGLVGPANHVGKRSIISGGRDMPDMPMGEMED